MPGESYWLKLHSSKYTNCDIGHPAIVRARGMASQACFTRGSKRPAVRAGTDGCRSKMAEIEERQHSKTDRIIIRRTFGVCVVLCRRCGQSPVSLLSAFGGLNRPQTQQPGIYVHLSRWAAKCHMTSTHLHVRARGCVTVVR